MTSIFRGALDGAVIRQLGWVAVLRCNAKPAQTIARDMDLARPQGQAGHRAHDLFAWRKIMRLEDDLPTPKPAGRFIPRDLEPMAVAELREYIGDLRAEIARVEADIVKKGDSRSAAEAFFRLKATE
jgi:uncharacterized small protein (DUF1192 family)